MFVDAGYLFAQGSVAIAGSKQPRSDLDLNVTAAIAELKSIAQSKCDPAPLLRIYWYDAPLGSGPTSHHSSLAHTDHIKLRLGFLNSQGQQKGVDSLIVTDLIELARNHAISDALLLSGDEDVRIGVVIAQSFGVRVHLLGIIPCRGSQSILLMQEADTTSEWDKNTVLKFLSLRPYVANNPTSPSTVPVSCAEFQPGGQAAEFEAVAIAIINELDAIQIEALHAALEGKQWLPSDTDGKFLARCRDTIGRYLDQTEKREARSQFVHLFKVTHPKS